MSHNQDKSSMQDGCFADAPMLVASIMSNGFKTPCGVLTVAPRLGFSAVVFFRSFETLVVYNYGALVNYK